MMFFSKLFQILTDFYKLKGLQSTLNIRLKFKIQPYTEKLLYFRCRYRFCQILIKNDLVKKLEVSTKASLTVLIKKMFGSK